MKKPIESHSDNPFLIFLLAASIGVIAGIIAWLFRLLIGFIHNFAFYGHLSPIYDANQHSPQSSWGWGIIAVTMAGGMVVVWLIKRFAPEAKGHGVPEVFYAIHHRQGRIKGRVSIVKALASAITIGTGGSVGREGPIIQIGAAFSSAIAQWFKLPASQRIVLLSCGASAGIAATFNAPLAGVLFSIELLLVSINSRTLLPIAVATVIAASVGHAIIGPEPAFMIELPPLPTDADAMKARLPLLLVYFPFGVVMGLAALLLIRVVYRMEDAFAQLAINDYQRHALGMLILGTTMCLLYREFGHYFVQGTGYATIQDILTGLLAHPGLLLLLFVAKLLATSLTIGSGGSGGVFSPSLFLGATLGALFGSVMAALFPAAGFSPIVFAVVGMASLVGASTSAPITAILITYEMTQSYSVILPVMAGVAIAHVVRRHFSETDIYTHKLSRRGQHIPEGRISSLNSHIKASECMSGRYRFAQVNEIVHTCDSITLVLDDSNIVGFIPPNHWSGVDGAVAGDIMQLEFSCVPPGLTLKSIVLYLTQKQQDFVILSRHSQRTMDDVVGIIATRDITGAMASALQLQH